jgi:hypothetical protein
MEPARSRARCGAGDFFYRKFMRTRRANPGGYEIKKTLKQLDGKKREI